MPILCRAAVLLATGLLTLLAVAPPAFAGRARVIKFPRFEVPARSDREICTYVRIPRKDGIDIGGSLIVNVGGNEEFTSHHFLMWSYTGKDPAGFGAPGELVDSKVCLDYGPPDRSQRVLVGGAQSPRYLAKVPRGSAQHIAPAVTASGEPDDVILVLNTHWINGSDRAQSASVKIKLLPVKGKIKRRIQPIFEVYANAFIKVPPGSTGEEVHWFEPNAIQIPGAGGLGGGSVPDGPACVILLTAHMHKRGKLFTIDFDDGASRRELWRAVDYSDPGQLYLNGKGPNPPPLLVQPGQRLIYTCSHDNGVTTDVKLGCEETPGVPPGRSAAEIAIECLTTPGCVLGQNAPSGAAKGCAQDADCPATDPAYPERQFTGRCVPANLVFGFTSDDDMCILPGAYYDAVEGAPPGRECDLSLL
jgi:hypothetical protein